MIISKSTFFVRFMDTDEVRTGLSESEAFRLAEEHCGNANCAKPFPGTFLFGPGDGTTSVMVRREFEITK